MQNFIDSLIAQGCSVVTNLRELGSVPPKAHRAWEVGCKLYFPGQLTVLSEPSKFNPDFGLPFVPVVVEFPDGTFTNDKCFLNTLVKKVRLYETKQWVEASGTAVDFLRNCDSWEVGLMQLRGNYIRISKIAKVDALAPSGNAYPTCVYDFELSGEYVLAA